MYRYIYRYPLQEAGFYKIPDISSAGSLACMVWSYLTIRTFKKKKVFYKAIENHKCYFHTIILRSFELPFKVSFIKSIELIPEDQI